MLSLSVAPHTHPHCACGLISNACPCTIHITRGAGLGTLRLRLPRRVPVGRRARQGAPPVRRPAPGAPVRGVVLAAHGGGGNGARLVASLKSACVCACVVCVVCVVVVCVVRVCVGVLCVWCVFVYVCCACVWVCCVCVVACVAHMSFHVDCLASILLTPFLCRVLHTQAVEASGCTGVDASAVAAMRAHGVTLVL